MVNTVERLWPSDPTSAAQSSPQPTRGSEKTTRLDDQSPAGSVAETTIMDIALSFSESYSCVQLAVSLELSQGSGFVVDSNLHASNREIAYDVMMEWKKEKGSTATGEWLYQVLHDDLKMVDLASRFKETLLGGCQHN